MKILDRLPLLTASQSIRFGNRHVSFHRNALVVWLSVGHPANANPRHMSPAFPALLDSGNNCECFLHEHHLIHWALMQPNQLQELGSTIINSQRVSRCSAYVWIHPNIPGTHERDPQASPFRLGIIGGVSVGQAHLDNTIFPRVPLLGFSALKTNALDYWFDSKHGCSYLRTADWRSRLVRWLYRLF